MTVPKVLLLSHILDCKSPSYGNRDKFSIECNSLISQGDSANSSRWVFSSNHLGTHIDMPNHFNELGKKSFEIPFNEYLFDNVLLVDIPCYEARLINSSDFSAINILNANAIELLLIRTGYEQYRKAVKYWKDNPGLAVELANYFRLQFPYLRCVGFDFISLTSWKFREEGRDSHRAFLSPVCGTKEILVIEDMALSQVMGPINRVIVAPIFVEDGNGGPVTIFAEMNSQ